jgi:hypothetical protein
MMQKPLCAILMSASATLPTITTASNLQIEIERTLSITDRKIERQLVEKAYPYFVENFDHRTPIKDLKAFVRKNGDGWIVHFILKDIDFSYYRQFSGNLVVSSVPIHISGDGSVTNMTEFKRIPAYGAIGEKFNVREWLAVLNTAASHIPLLDGMVKGDISIRVEKLFFYSNVYRVTVEDTIYTCLRFCNSTNKVSRPPHIEAEDATPLTLEEIFAKSYKSKTSDIHEQHKLDMIRGIRLGSTGYLLGSAPSCYIQITPTRFIGYDPGFKEINSEREKFLDPDWRPNPPNQ